MTTYKYCVPTTKINNVQNHFPSKRFSLREPYFSWEGDLTCRNINDFATALLWRRSIANRRRHELEFINVSR